MTFFPSFLGILAAINSIEVPQFFKTSDPRRNGANEPKTGRSPLLQRIKLHHRACIQGARSFEVVDK